MLKLTGADPPPPSSVDSLPGNVSTAGPVQHRGLLVGAVSRSVSWRVICNQLSGSWRISSSSRHSSFHGLPVCRQRPCDSHRCPWSDFTPCPLLDVCSQGLSSYPPDHMHMHPQKLHLLCHHGSAPPAPPQISLPDNLWYQLHHNTPVLPHRWSITLLTTLEVSIYCNTLTWSVQIKWFNLTATIYCFYCFEKLRAVFPPSRSWPTSTYTSSTLNISV